jgi:prepilin-type N-terminal cleavage/methylation domain-containing protein
MYSPFFNARSLEIGGMKTNQTKGFTLVELLVTIAIFVFMTAVIMAKYNSFYSGTIFKNIAYDIALTIRQAQTYGISVKINESPNYNRAYGVNISALNSTVNRKFSLNSYTPNNLVYNIASSEKIYNIKHGAFIRYIHTYDFSAGGDRLTDVDIIFKRPNPEAIICATDLTTSVRSCGYKTVRIAIRSGNGVDSKYVFVNSSGQIVVKDSP